MIKNKAVAVISLLLLAGGQAMAQTNAEGAWQEALSPAVRLLEDSARQKMLNGALIDASWRGNLAEVHRLIALGADKNGTDDFSRTPLMMASIWGHAEIIEFLLQVGADVNAKAGCQYTALHEAAQFGQLKAIKTLAAAGAEIDAKGCLGDTPFFTAVQHGSSETAAAFLAFHADPNVQLYDGTTPLIQAVKQYRPWLIELLQSSPRLDANKADDKGLTALKHAVKSNLPYVVELVLKTPGLDVNDNAGGVSALFLAQVAGNQEIVALLREAGAHE